MKIEIDGILPAVSSMPITEWEIYVDGEKQIIRSFESRGFREFAIEVEPKVIKKIFEEEKKMLNVDKYREELLEEMKFKKEKLNDCENDNYNGVEIYFRSIEAVKRRHGGGCSKFFSDDVKWLFSEYKPPLLENGDELKPGDLIMVLNEEKQRWEKRKFLAFFRDSFYCISYVRGSMDGHSYRDLSGEFTCYKQARLPEEDD